MAKPQSLFNVAPQIPETVRDETATVPKGEIGYWFLFTDDEVELMATGICPARASEMAFNALSWKREFYRNAAREKVSA